MRFLLLMTFGLSTFGLAQEPSARAQGEVPEREPGPAERPFWRPVIMGTHGMVAAPSIHWRRWRG